MLQVLNRMWQKLAASQTGSITVETAIIAPVLITLSIGGFEVSTIVARQSELQSAAAEAAAIVRAAPPESEAQRTAIRNIVATSSKVQNSAVSVSEAFRCNNAQTYVTTRANCAQGAVVSKYIRVTIADTYEPMWTGFGLGYPLEFNVSRTILVG